ncbi:hypothetical protein MLD38_040071 [Melastoma candidum]|uniref:Uncharacterized protein n=1 Tax=Melastoma candidum TaxID=119954 RepID=A0ACB9L4X6_9MYRT|nr:hypothetical protein MLD38_040071 [Melastoma candidum]
MVMMIFVLLASAVLSAALLILRTKPPPSSGSRAAPKTVPEVPGAWPVIGHLHLLGGQTPFCKILASLSDSVNSPIFRILLGVYPTVIISDPDLVRDCFTTHDKALASRPRCRAGIHLGYDYAAFGFLPYGPFWREIRKMTMVELLGGRRLEILKHVRSEEVEYFIGGLYGMCKGKRGEQSVRVVLSELLEHLSLNIILRMISGRRYFVGAELGEEGSHLRQVIKNYMYISGLPAVSDFVPFMGWTDHMGTIRRMKKVAWELDCIVDKWVEEHKAARKARGGKDSDNSDFIDVMLSVLGENPVYGHPPENVIKGTITTIIVAGSDTTALNLTWTLSLLLNHEHALRRAQEELDAVVGRERWVEEKDLQNLPYLQAIIKESLRLYPPGPTGVPHEATEDCVVNGYWIPKGTRIIVNLWKLHRDPSVWSDPEIFEPDRFMTTHSSTDTSGQHYEYVPFGSGRRSCPGSMLALQVGHLTLGRLLQGFEIGRTSEVVDMTEGLGINLPKATPLEALVCPRLPSRLYE